MSALLGVALHPELHFGCGGGVVRVNPNAPTDLGGHVEVVVVVAGPEVNVVADGGQAEGGVDAVLPVELPVGLFDVVDGHLHALMVTDLGGSAQAELSRVGS